MYIIYCNAVILLHGNCLICVNCSVWGYVVLGVIVKVLQLRVIAQQVVCRSIVILVDTVTSNE